MEEPAGDDNHHLSQPVQHCGILSSRGRCGLESLGRLGGLTANK